MNVAVLLATYNGEAYLQSFLDSLARQTFNEFDLIVHDDKSSDLTLSIIESYMSQLKIRCKINQNRLGPAKNFFSLIEETCLDYEYYLLADQDDVWDNEKVERQLQYLQRKNPTIPSLLGSNYRILDEKTSRVFLLSESHTLNFWEIIVRTPFPGCSMAFNSALAKVLKRNPIPDGVMHDRWIAVNAAIFGDISKLNDYLFSYRVHENNTIGISAGLINRLFRFISSIMDNSKVGGIYSAVPIANTLVARNIDSYERVNFESIKLLVNNQNIISKLKIINLPIYFKSSLKSIVVRFALLVYVTLKRR